MKVFIVYVPVRNSDEERQRLLKATAARLRAIEPEKPTEAGEYQGFTIPG